MSYTVISLFPIAIDTDAVKQKLESNGFDGQNILISKYNIEGELMEDMEEDDRTRSFWDYLFGNSRWKTAYQKAGIDNNTVTVYAEDIENARKAKQVMDEMGAIDIQKYRKEHVESGYEIDEDEEARIIAKARHNIYFLDGSRTYRPTSRGKAGRMDSMGSKD